MDGGGGRIFICTILTIFLSYSISHAYWKIAKVVD